jgi:endonuclease/exonuclease/phosphatase family metal-dependent hydrolase
MTYNVHRCIGNDAQLSPERIAEVIAQAEPDVVCLQELDSGRLRTQRQNQAQRIADRLGMKVYFFAAIRLAEEHYGDAILSRDPLRLERAALLPWPKSMLAFEPRGALWVSLTCDGIEWQVINTHFGLGRAERRLQAAALASPEWIGTARQKPPLIVCGDFNSRPASKVHRILAEHVTDAQLLVGGRRHRTFSTRLPMLCLDYVFVTSEVRVRELRTIRTPLARVASDHFPLVAEVAVEG